MALINCKECNKEISDSATACPNCGAPTQALAQRAPSGSGKVKFTSKQESNNGEKRHVGFLLGLGIVFFPIIFVWFLLRKGHSTTSRIIGFGYFIIGSILSIMINMAAVDAIDKQGFSSASSSGNAAEATEQAPPVELAQFTSIEIERDYDANTVSADQKYKGKRFIVNGKINSINTDITNSPYVEMATTGFLGAQAHFKSGQENTIAALKKGQQISLECTGKGDIGKVPMLDDCVFVQ